jgi:hypothetical protein
VSHLSNRFLVQKLPDRNLVVRWRVVMLENEIGPKFRPFSSTY